MTTKDYKILTSALGRALAYETTMDGRAAIERTIDITCDHLKDDNSRFDEKLFKTAIKDELFDLATGQGRR